ncbi:HEAT repeat domain-containing protein [PVC group bacterium]|nr:HEAT repeat domain-containing protein [PVC group bacterium]
MADIEAGRLEAAPSAVAALAKDPHVLVRRRVMYALSALEATDQVSAIEGGLFDAESSVRMAAAGALAKVNGPNSAGRTMAALEKDGYFQMKMACVEALGAMKEQALPEVLKGTESDVHAVREVSVRALYKLAKAGLLDQACNPLRRSMLSRSGDERVRYHAIEGLVGLRLKLGAERQQQLANDLMALATGESSVIIQLRAAWGLGYMHGALTPALRTKALAALSDGFRKYGDGCRRSDAAFGWRVFGNAMLQYHKPGRDALEAMRVQRDDRWLAWLAYEVVHLPHRWCKIVQIDEDEAVRSHERYAPPFPGCRRW